MGDPLDRPHHVAFSPIRFLTGQLSELDVEDERKLSLVMTRDLRDGSVHWRGLGVVNPFEEDGSLADFARYPRFAAYMEKHAYGWIHRLDRRSGAWEWAGVC